MFEHTDAATADGKSPWDEFGNVSNAGGALFGAGNADTSWMNFDDCFSGGGGGAWPASLTGEQGLDLDGGDPFDGGQNGHDGIALVDEFLGFETSNDGPELVTDPLKKLELLRQQKEEESRATAKTRGGAKSGGAAMNFIIASTAAVNNNNNATTLAGAPSSGRELFGDSPSPHRPRPNATVAAAAPPLPTTGVDLFRDRPSDNGVVARARPRPPPPSTKPANPFNIALAVVDPVPAPADDDDDDGADDDADDVFDFDEMAALRNNPFAGGINEADTLLPGGDAFLETDDVPGDGSDFNPFATITDEETATTSANNAVIFDPFQTIHDDFDLDLTFTSTTADANGGGGESKDGEEGVSPSRFNPFDKEPPLPEKFASLEPQPRPGAAVAAVAADEGSGVRGTPSTEASFDDLEAETLEPLEPFFMPWGETGVSGWNMLLRQPFKKKFSHNRFWKTAHVRASVDAADTPFIRIYPDEKSSECLHELVLQPSYQLCEMGLQQLDQFGKCHTVKLQQVAYRESVGVKADRIAPTIGDLTRVRDLKSLKDLVHKPKATMILDHAAQPTEILKFGGLDYAEFKNFVHTVEDMLFALKSIRGKSASYTKDEITVDVQDEYYADIDKGTPGPNSRTL